MGKRIRDRVTVANVLAGLALFVALGTGAASALPGKGSVDRNDIRANAVNAKKIVDGSVSGLEVNEASLGQVPSAANATSARTADSADSASSAARATSAGSAATAQQAADADRIGGLSVRAVTRVVDLPTFAAGQNLCKSVQVDLPGVKGNDHVLMTSDGIPTYVGEDQVSLEVHSVGDGEVEVQGCVSADATTPISPTQSGYVFLVFAG